MSGSDAWIAKDVHERQTAGRRRRDGRGRSALGFDGSLNDDTTVLRGCRMSDGFLFKIGAGPSLTAPAGDRLGGSSLEVLAAIREAFGRYDVVRMYADPHEWRSDIETLGRGTRRGARGRLGDARATWRWARLSTDCTPA